MYYSQFQEDEFIVKYCNRYNLQLIPVAIEIGASNGVSISNIRHFCTEKGFKGIYVEPHPSRFAELQKNTSGQDAKLYNNACIGEGQDKEVRFKIEPCADFSHIEHSGDHNAIAIGLYWSDILKENDITAIGVLSIDVEGYEMPILQDVAKANVRPQFLIIESNATLERKAQMEMLIKAGYHLHRMKDKNMLWMDGDIFTPDQDNAIYDVR